MRYVAVLATSMLAIVLIGLGVLETAVRGGTCGPSEGGGSCAAGPIAWLLLVGALIAIGATIVLVVRQLRRG